MEKSLRACPKNTLPLLLHPERFRGTRRGLGSTAIELGDLSKEFAVLSPSPPLEERAGERRPFNCTLLSSLPLKSCDQTPIRRSISLNLSLSMAGRKPNAPPFLLANAMG